MQESKSIVSRMVNGIAWMVAARLMDRLFGVASTLILARLLVPADFGLVAMATAVAALLELLGAFSFDMALIQKANAQRRHYDTVWTFGILFGLGFAALLVLLAYPAAHFYNEPRLPPIMYTVALSYVIGAFNNVGTVEFRKELHFHKEFYFILIRRLATFGVTIAAAWLLRSYWALLLGTLMGRIVNCISSYMMHRYRPRLSLEAAGELFHFSKWLLLNNFLFYLLTNGPSFVVGRVMGAHALGMFTVSNEIASLPTTELTAPINRATFPAMSKMRERAEVRDTYVKLFGMITLFALPIGFGLAAVAPQLIPVMLGYQWQPATQLMQLLAIYCALASTQSNNNTVWLALGHPRLTTLTGAIFLLVLFPILFVLMPGGGLESIGLSYLLACTVFIPVGLLLTRRMLGFSWRVLGGTAVRPVLGVAAMWLAVDGVGSLLDGAPLLVLLAAKVAAGALVYVAVVLLLWYAASCPEGSEQVLLDKLKLRFRARLAVQDSKPM